MPSPLQCYRDDLAKGIIKPDAAQALAVNELQRLFEELLQAREKPSGLLASLSAMIGTIRQPAPIKGLYIYGGVGRGSKCTLSWLR
jgi:cell division protein ZapE